MDQDFFSGESPQKSTPVNNGSNFQQNQGQDEFDFGDAQYEAPSTSNQQNLQSYGSQNSNQYGSSNNFDNVQAVDIETTKKIREQEERIQQKLRQKSDTEYQNKRKRKEEGKRQLQEFLEKKQQDTVERKRENRQKQQTKINQYKKLSQQAGWKKVAASVSLKQGELKTQRDINRMRQAIINKRQDQN